MYSFGSSGIVGEVSTLIGVKPKPFRPALDCAEDAAQRERTLEAASALGEEHPHTLASVNDLAGLYRVEGRFAEAEPHYKHALEARERVLGRIIPLRL